MKPLRVHPLWIGSVLGFILLLIVWNCFVPNQAAIPDVIRIGVEDDYVPFSYTDEKGQRAGFDVDISSALCKKLNFRCEILPMPFGKLLPELSKGNLTMVVAGIGITPDRAKHFLFTNVYYRSRSFFITNNRKLAPAQHRQCCEACYRRTKRYVSTRTHRETLYSCRCKDEDLCKI